MSEATSFDDEERAALVYTLSACISILLSPLLEWKLFWTILNPINELAPAPKAIETLPPIGKLELFIYLMAAATPPI